MAYDTKLADRIRAQLGGQEGLLEKKMFGGVAFMLHGNLACGVHGNDMIVRLAPAKTDAALTKSHTRIFDLSGGRPMKGWLLVGPDGVRTDAALAKWVAVGVSYARTLPAK